MRFSAVLSVLFSAAAIVSAQTPAELAAQIPHCAEPCDVAALQQTGCDLTNYACHCTYGDFLRATIVPCLQQNSTCTPEEIRQFAAIPPKICAAVSATANATVAATGTVITIRPTASSMPLRHLTALLRILTLRTT